MAIHFVVPCGSAKLVVPAAARDLYTGPHFRYVLGAVEAEAELTGRRLGVATRVWILSARYGLVDLDRELAPYDLTITQPGAVTAFRLAAQAAGHGFGDGDEVFALLPADYRVRLAEALGMLGVAVIDVY